jgi:S-adenosylmethionine:tRNA-ribosyltransferase-isomerase (queuine synthetase)
MLDHTMKELLPKHYRKDAVVKTRWLWRDSTLEIWVRDDAAGRDAVLAAYTDALEAGYRFLSYGDAMWLPRRA